MGTVKVPEALCFPGRRVGAMQAKKCTRRSAPPYTLQALSGTAVAAVESAMLVSRSAAPGRRARQHCAQPSTASRLPIHLAIYEHRAAAPQLRYGAGTTRHERRSPWLAIEVSYWRCEGWDLDHGAPIAAFPQECQRRAEHRLPCQSMASKKPPLAVFGDDAWRASSVCARSWRRRAR